MRDSHERARLKKLIRSGALAVWHDHSDICGMYSEINYTFYRSMASFEYDLLWMISEIVKQCFNAALDNFGD